jgi:hypothetical protein
VIAHYRAAEHHARAILARRRGVALPERVECSAGDAASTCRRTDDDRHSDHSDDDDSNDGDEQCDDDDNADHIADIIDDRGDDFDVGELIVIAQDSQVDSERSYSERQCGECERRRQRRR